MRPIRTETSSFTYRGPTPAIADLPCRREDGAVYAVFEVTDEDRERIANGANVELGIYHEPIPPVSLNVVDETAQFAPGDRQCQGCRAIYSAGRDDVGQTCGQCGDLLITLVVEDVNA